MHSVSAVITKEANRILEEKGTKGSKVRVREWGGGGI